MQCIDWSIQVLDALNVSFLLCLEGWYIEDLVQVPAYTEDMIVSDPVLPSPV